MKLHMDSYAWPIFLFEKKRRDIRVRDFGSSVYLGIVIIPLFSYTNMELHMDSYARPIFLFVKKRRDIRVTGRPISNHSTEGAILFS